MVDKIRILTACAALGLAACGSALDYTWIEDVPATELASVHRGDYVIATGDLLAVRVYNQEALSSRGRVRPDGKISVPLAGEVVARGRRPADLARDVEALLKPFMVAPAVVVSVEEIQPMQISVLGEVARPGVFALEPGAGILAALASAGGTTEFADRDRVFVLRKRAEGPPLKIRFTYARLTGSGGAAFVLADGDVVMVE